MAEMVAMDSPLPPNTSLPLVEKSESCVSASSPGGLSTNSPPSKISWEAKDEFSVLSCGIDWLTVAVDVYWSSEEFFVRLAELKAKAKEEKRGQVVSLLDGSGDRVYFEVRPSGASGYEWLLTSDLLSLKIGDWPTPQSRPSVMVEIRSETLWRLGPKAALAMVLSLLDGCGAQPASLRVSRVDLCLDLLLPESLWNADLARYAVTRAADRDTYERRGTFTGLKFGKGSIVGRVYDKVAEIRSKSGKVWMFSIWGLDGVPTDCRVVRTECQWRREALVRCGVDITEDLWRLSPNLWSYFTGHWLKFQDSLGKQSHQRKTLPWWKAVQDGYDGCQGSAPAVPVISRRVRRDQLLAQCYGLMSSYSATGRQGQNVGRGETATVEQMLRELREALDEKHIDDKKLTEDIQVKLAKWQRLHEKEEHGLWLRRELGIDGNGEESSKP
jgi:hypothetical protein